MLKRAEATWSNAKERVRQINIGSVTSVEKEG
jgi:hypothetical protein